MRQVVYSVAMSLDGYISGPRGEADWIVIDPDIDFGAMLARFDVILMGRKTYEATRTNQGGSMPGIDSYVFSHTLRQADHRGVMVSDDPSDTVIALRDQPGKDIWLFGGGALFRSMLELGLVNRIEVAIVPVMLGGGVPLVPESPIRANLQLIRHRIYTKTGTALLEYAITAAGPRGRHRS